MLPKLKILVVEHERDMLRQWETTLKTMGLAPRCLASSQKAAEFINKEKFDGAFLDWDTPELKGEELTQRIRHSRSNAKIPITMITEHNDTRSIAQGFKIGVTFFLSKPVGAKELRRLLKASHAALIEERRQYQRAPLAVPVSCAWEGRRAVGKAVNVSASGLLLRLSECPEPSSVLRLDFILPRPQQWLELKALVARTAPENQLGVKFIGLSREQRELLMAYTDRTLGTHPAL